MKYKYTDTMLDLYEEFLEIEKHECEFINVTPYRNPTFLFVDGARTITVDAIAECIHCGKLKPRMYKSVEVDGIWGTTWEEV